MGLPTDRDARNALPIWDGLMMYFPDVWAEIAKVSVLGNKQHNLGTKLFWNREVSTDHLNKVMRHCLDHVDRKRARHRRHVPHGEGCLARVRGAAVNHRSAKTSSG